MNLKSLKLYKSETKPINKKNMKNVDMNNDNSIEMLIIISQKILNQETLQDKYAWQ